MKKSNDSVLFDNREYQPFKKNIYSNQNMKFSKQEVSLADTPLFFIERYEKTFILLYFISLPYILGLFFLFFYISKGKSELFLPLSQSISSIFIWLIGYEILAVLILLLILRSAILFTRKINKKGKRKFQIP